MSLISTALPFPPPWRFFADYILHIEWMLLIALMIIPIYFDSAFLLLISFSNSCSSLELSPEMFSSFPWRSCITFCISYRSCCKSRISFFSYYLVSSISLSICFFLSMSFSFSFLKLRNLLLRASMFSNSLFSSSSLSLTTFSKKSLKI